MSFQLVHLIGSPPESLIEVLRQELNQEALVQSFETPDLAEAQQLIPTLIPDLIVFFVSDTAPYDTIRDLTQQIRIQLNEYRPIVVISSDEADKDQRIDYFLSGADDYLSTRTEAEEFAVRLLVHLRRNVEVHSNSQTRLPGLPLFSRLVQRKLNLDIPWAFLMIEITHFQAYTEVYGRIPSEQILKTLASLLKSLIHPPDIVGQTESDTFLVLTTPDKAEWIAKHLCAQFDEIVPNFYAEKDQKRGYIVSIVNEQISRRVPFVNLSIGLVSSDVRPFKHFPAVLNSVIEMRQQARVEYGSNWASERAKLTGEITAEQYRIKRIVILETDAAMAFLLKSTLEMQGYQVETVIRADEVKTAFEQQVIDLVMMDPANLNRAEHKALCEWMKSHQAKPEPIIISLSSSHDREQALGDGADLYLPKPFELSTLFTWVDKFLK